MVNATMNTRASGQRALRRLFYQRLQAIAPQTAVKPSWHGLNAFSRLNTGLRPAHESVRKTALLPDAEFQPKEVEVGLMNAAELRAGFEEWQKTAGYTLQNPLDRAQESAARILNFDLADKLEWYAGRTLAVRDYETMRIEAYGIFHEPTNLWLMENAPWNQAAETRSTYGSASLLWEVLFENAIAGARPNLYRSTEQHKIFGVTQTDDTVRRLSLLFLQPWKAGQYPNGENIVFGLFHLQLFRSLVLQDNPSLAQTAKDLAIPEGVIAPFVRQTADLYQRYKLG